MKIKEFSIRRYGPLPDTGPVKLSDFSLLYGKNDDGKTLTIDAIVKLLLKAGRGIFRNIDRVDHEPDGYLFLDYEGSELKVPEKGYLADIAKLSPQDFRNVFIIRDSDLSIPPDNELTFYKNVTDRLTGLRSTEISGIKRELQKLGRLTKAESDAKLSDSTSFGSIGSRVHKGKNLLARIPELEKELQREGFDELEKDISSTQMEIDKCEAELHDLELARKRRIYEEAGNALDTLESNIKQLRSMKAYNEEDERIWGTAETQTKERKKDEEQSSAELKEKESRYESKKELLSKKEGELLVHKAIKDEIDNQIQPEIVKYRIDSGELARHRTTSRFFVGAVIASALLLAISVLGLVLRPSPVFYILTAIFSIGLLVSAGFILFFTQKKAWLAGMFERIKLSASRLKLSGVTVQEILSNIQGFKNEYTIKEKEIDAIRDDVHLLEGQIRDIKDNKLPEIREKIRDAENNIDSVKGKVDVATLEEYRERLRSKGRYNTEAARQMSRLETLFGSSSKSIEENLSYWRNEVKALEQFKGAARDVIFEENAVERLNAGIKDLRGHKEQLRARMANYSRQLAEIEKDVYDILRMKDDYLHCTTSQDMKAIKDKLESFIHRVEEARDNALAVIAIFEQIGQEEDEKVSQLFGKDSLVPKYFSEITGGIYQEVELVSDESDVRRIQVKLKNGKTLYADKLLGGAYDQLYLSVRLALGERLLKGERGFFIMDDPFIKADPDRLKRQLDILKRISQLGWQIIYFTAKDEIRNALKKDIESGKVDFKQLEGVFS